jgi:hypothetical protein
MSNNSADIPLLVTELIEEDNITRKSFKLENLEQRHAAVEKDEDEEVRVKPVDR